MRTRTRRVTFTTKSLRINGERIPWREINRTSVASRGGKTFDVDIGLADGSVVEFVMTPRQLDDFRYGLDTYWMTANP